MTIAAITSVTVTLILVGIFLSLILNTNNLAKELENNVRVVAYMRLDVHDQSQTIQDPNNAGKTITNPNYQQVYNEIKQIPNVKSVTFSSKDAQLKQLTDSLGKAWTIFKGDANPLYDAYIIQAAQPKNVAQISADVKKLSQISQVNDGGANTKKIFSLSNVIQTWGAVGALLLILVAVFLISNTIRITIIARSREIQIMRLVGAKNSYIRWPFFLEGAWVGLVGAIIPAFLVGFLYQVAYQGLEKGLESQAMSLLKPAQFIPFMTILIFALGIIIGALGSVISMRRYLKA
jgi:cell division transport system permease protein